VLLSEIVRLSDTEVALEWGHSAIEPKEAAAVTSYLSSAWEGHRASLEAPFDRADESTGGHPEESTVDAS
jgi:hypothetical protein